MTTALTRPRALLSLDGCRAVGPAGLLPEGGTGQPGALFLRRRSDQVAAVPGVPHVQP